MRHCHCHSNLLMAPPRESETCHFQSPMTIFSTPSSLALTPSSSSPHLGSPHIISKLCSLSNSTSFRATDFARVSSFNFLAYYSLTDVPEQLISRYLSHALALRFHRTPTSDCGTRTLVSGAAYGCGVQPASCSIVVACRAKQQRSRPDARRRRPHPRRPTLFLFFTFVDMWRAECGVRVWVCLGYLESNTFSSLGEGEFQCECSFRYVLQSSAFLWKWLDGLATGSFVFRGYDRTYLVCVGLESSFLDVVIFFC